MSLTNGAYRFDLPAFLGTSRLASEGEGIHCYCLDTEQQASGSISKLLLQCLGRGKLKIGVSFGTPLAGLFYARRESFNFSRWSGHGVSVRYGHV